MLCKYRAENVRIAKIGRGRGGGGASVGTRPILSRVREIDSHRLLYPDHQPAREYPAHLKEGIHSTRTSPSQDNYLEQGGALERGVLKETSF